jgi:hypothetical protein
MEDDEPRTVYVKFGPKNHQEISVELASMMLTDWREHEAGHFGKYLARAMTGENPKGGRDGR